MPESEATISSSIDSDFFIAEICALLLYAAGVGGACSESEIYLVALEDSSE